MTKDCIEYARSCEECQRHGNLQHVPAFELYTIIKPCPFRDWALDIIGQINPLLLKGHMFILVVIDHFTIWVEAVPLKNVMQKEIINFVKEKLI